TSGSSECRPGCSTQSDCDVYSGPLYCKSGDGYTYCGLTPPSGAGGSSGSGGCSYDSECDYDEICRYGSCVVPECTHNSDCYGCSRCSDNNCVACIQG